VRSPLRIGRSARTPPGLRLLMGGAVASAIAIAITVAVTTEASSPAALGVAARPLGSAPNFTLSRLTGGAPVNLTAIARGRPVILSFFASWCEGCRGEMAAMAALARAAGARVQVIGIDVNDETGPARRLLVEARTTYPVGVDSDGSVADRYRLVGLPITVFLDARHRVVGRALGPLTSASGRAWLAAIERTAA
jgi:cytochrome c biogenesis protein CcmG, thiol:disulfide interchange protein DsbE